MKKIVQLYLLLIAILSFSSAGAQDANYAIGGQVLFTNSNPVPNVIVLLLDESGNIIDTTITTSGGVYRFNGLANQAIYTIEPLGFLGENQQSWLNGLTTLDLVLIMKYLLDEGNELVDPLQLIAADIDGSGSVSVLDLVYLSQAILGIIANPPGASWRFLRSDWIFDLDNLYIGLDQAASARVLINGTNQIINFDAVKIGDVNSTAVISN